MTSEAQQKDVRTSTLWLTLASGPLLWAAYHSLAYALTSQACQKGFWLEPLVGPISALTVALFAITVVFLQLIALGGYKAYTAWKTFRGSDEAIGSPGSTRPGFMAFSGFALNLLFGVVTLVTFLASLFFNPCS